MGARVLRVLIGLVLLGASLACRATPGEPRDTLVVASDLDNPPFALVDEDGRPRGRDVEMMERLGSELGLEVVWRRVPFDELLERLEAGEADVVCATLGITPERGQRVTFTRPYFHTAIAVLVRDEDGPRRLAELAGRRVAASRGTTSQRALERASVGAFPVLDNEKGLASAERLLRREVDAVVMDRPNAERLAAESEGALRVMEDDLAPENYALALPKGSTRLRDRLDRALERLAREGWLRALDERHGL